jgi:predicted transcriptional regulator
MSTTLSVRVDDETEHELAELARGSTSRNAAIVTAIHESYRRAAYERMRRESDRLRDDPVDRAEVQAARQALGGGDAW